MVHESRVNLGGLVVLLASFPTFSGGLYLQEFATPVTGTAGAGASALARDASTAFHNPAGMSQLDSAQFMVGGGLIATEVRFDPDGDTPVAGNDGGNAGSVAPLLSAHYARPLNDRWAIGVANYSVAAAVLDFDTGWAGRYQVEEVTLLTTTLLLSASYRINDHWALGGGVSYLYGKVEQDIALPNLINPGAEDGRLKLDVDGDDFGGMVSLLWTPTADTRFGLGYATELDPDLEGDISVAPRELEGSTQVDLIFPETIRFGAYHQTQGPWAFVGQLNWENWGAFESIDFKVGDTTVVTERNWRDTYTYAGGIHYQLDPRMMLMAGVSYTDSPVKTQDRTVDLPVDRQIRLAFGLERRLYGDRTLTMALEWVDLGKARVDNNLVKGEFDSNNMLVATISYNWP